MLKKLYALVLKNPLKYLLIFGLVTRILIWFLYNGITIAPDSKTYVELSTHLYNFNFENYSGRRTPGFPLLIAISGGNLYITVIIQQVIGLLCIFFIYDFTYHKTMDKVTTFWTTFISSSFLHFIFYEFAILTESLSLFLVVLVFWLIQKQKLLEEKSNIIHYVLLSIIMGFLYLTRPMFIYFPIIFASIFILKNFKGKLKKVFLKAFIIIILPFICFHSWSSINKNNIGYYTNTYFFGLNLSQVTTTFFEKAPEEDKLIRDVFVKHRDSIKAVNPSDIAMSVWHAFPELSEKTKLNEPDLCNELGIISKKLIREHPLLYSKQVLISWIDFWGTKSTFALNKEKITHIIPTYLIFGLWKLVQQYILILINILFIIFSIKKVYNFILSKFRPLDLDLLIILIVIGGSVAQALVIYGDNSRFCYPYLPLIVYFVAKNIIQLNPIYSKCKKYFNLRMLLYTKEIV